MKFIAKFEQLLKKPLKLYKIILVKSSVESWTDVITKKWSFSSFIIPWNPDKKRRYSSDFSSSCGFIRKARRFRQNIINTNGFFVISERTTFKSFFSSSVETWFFENERKNWDARAVISHENRAYTISVW